MIVHNEFKKFQEIVEKIDQEMFYNNLYIYRLPKGTPRNINGKIYIDDTDDEDYFAGVLIHEAGHNVFDPVTAFNYVTCANKIAGHLGVDVDKALMLANIGSDLLNGYMVSKNEVLNSYRRKSIEYIYKRFYEQSIESIDAVRRELIAILGKLHGANIPIEPKYFNQVMAIINSRKAREDKYVEIAKIFLHILEEEKQEGGQKEGGQKEGEKEGGEQFGEIPIEVDSDEAEEIAKQILQNSSNIDEAKRGMAILGKITRGGIKTDVSLREFYEAKARSVLMFLEYPEEYTQKGIKLGSMKWRPEYGMNVIDVKRTIMKYGVNVPLVTTQTPRILSKFISSTENKKPVDLVISIDCSGSTEHPEGKMVCASDYEVVMFYALVNMAKRLDQRIGLTLWSSSIEYTTLPKTLDWREVDELKKEIIDNWSCGGTRIIFALRQAKENPEKLFFIFTDGEVDENELIDVDNVMFFLVKPYRKDYERFVTKYGLTRVVKIDDLKSIPKIALKKYLKIFRR